jgi:hypothetical protein
MVEARVYEPLSAVGNLIRIALSVVFRKLRAWLNWNESGVHNFLGVFDDSDPVLLGHHVCHLS